MKIGRYNYEAQFGPDLAPLIDDLRSMLVAGRYNLTAEVLRFEAEFAEYLGVRHACGVNCGTDALTIALLALGVGPGDEVITQANTFHATVAAIERAGATPVLVDADPVSFLIDERQTESAITPRTRAIIPVHLYGKPTPMKELLGLAAHHRLEIVEDAAQAHGALIDGRAVGTFGKFGCFSFHPSKNLAAAGDAGALVTNSEDLDARARLLRELGQHGQNNHVVLGLNSKLDAIQARVLSCKLPRLDAWNRDRRVVAGWYREWLAGLPVSFQRADPGETHVYHLFQIRTTQRDRLLEHLRAEGVDAVVRYPTPIHLQPAFARFGWQAGQFPVAEQLASELICLPIRPDLTLAEVEYVCDLVEEFFRSRPAKRRQARAVPG